AVVASDSRHRVWFNGRSGLTVVAPDGDLRTLSRSDGLIWDDVGPDGVREESDGSFVIATSRGLARFAPDAALTHPRAPDVGFTTITLAGRVLRTDIVPGDSGAVAASPSVGLGAGSLDVAFTPKTLSNP